MVSDCQRVSSLWSGNVLEPNHLLNLYSILVHIRDQIDERRELIGNWLYCLRDDVKTAEVPPSGGRKRQKVDKSKRDWSGRPETVPPQEQDQTYATPTTSTTTVAGPRDPASFPSLTRADLCSRLRQLPSVVNDATFVKAWTFRSACTFQGISNSGGQVSPTSYRPRLFETCLLTDTAPFPPFPPRFPKPRPE